MSNAKDLLINHLQDKSSTISQFRYIAMLLAEILAHEAAFMIQIETINIKKPTTLTQAFKINKQLYLFQVKPITNWGIHRPLLPTCSIR